MTETKQTSTTKRDRRPDCVTEIRMGNSVLYRFRLLQAGRNRHRSRQDDESAGSGSCYTKKRRFDRP